MEALDSLLVRVNQYIINPVLGFLVVLAVAYFLFGVVEYFLYTDNSTKREQGAKHILWGLIGLLIMVGFYGIIQILAGTIGQPVQHP